MKNSRLILPFYTIHCNANDVHIQTSEWLGDKLDFVYLDLISTKGMKINYVCNFETT